MTERLPLVFICGLHRSGKSKLYRALGAHPRISVFATTPGDVDEGQHLQSLLPLPWEMGGIAAFGYHPQAAADENHPLARAQTAETLYSAWSEAWQAGGEVLLEQSPSNILRTRFLQQLFPASRFIILTRHPFALVGELMRYLENRNALRIMFTRALDHAAHCYARVMADLPFLSQVRVLSFEALCAGPDAECDAIFRWLNLGGERVDEPFDTGINENAIRFWDDQVSVWGRQRIVKPNTRHTFKTLGYAI